MTDPGTTARQLAINAEVRKIAYRQTKDGVVISFLLHPNEVPDGLAIADLGARYMMALVLIGDDEQPVPPPTKEVKVEPVAELPARPRKVAADKRLAQQAGIACADPVFQRYLYEHHGISEQTEQYASNYVRHWCGVKSRAEIILGSEAAMHWEILYGKFTAWRLAT